MTHTTGSLSETRVVLGRVTKQLDTTVC